MTPIFTPGDSLDSYDLTGEYDRPVYVTVSDEPTMSGLWAYIVTWGEGLTWHRDHLARTFDVDDDALERMNALVADELGSDDAADELQLDCGVAYLDPEEDSLDITTTLFLPADATLGDLQRAAWPFIATCINVTDPGTFGCRYIMSALTEEN